MSSEFTDIFKGTIRSKLSISICFVLFLGKEKKKKKKKKGINEIKSKTILKYFQKKKNLTNSRNPPPILLYNSPKVHK